MISNARVAIERAESRFVRLRRQHRWLDHVVRARVRYTERYGDQHAAAITYFSVLSLVPVVMITFSVAGFVFAAHPALMDKMINVIAAAIPPELAGTVQDIVVQAVASRGSVGIIGLAAALYAGLGWMTNMRDALTAQWAVQRAEVPYLRKIGNDSLALLGLSFAIAAYFVVTVGGGVVVRMALRAVGLAGFSWTNVLFNVFYVLLSLLANWLVFLWVLVKLPREPVSMRSAMRGGVIAAIGVEVLKQAGSYYLRAVSHSRTSAAFGSLVGLLLLLLFIYLLARFVLYMTAWIATARENQRGEPVPVPPPAVIRPAVMVRTGPNIRTAAGLVGVGAVAALALQRALRALTRT